MKTGAALLLPALLAIATAGSAAAPAPVTGRWLTENGRALVEIGRCGATLCGTIRKVLKPIPGRPATDAQNPDPALRSRPAEGLTILTGFTAGSDRWQGRIYDPESGKTYKSYVQAQGDGTLKVSGCILFLCRTQSWTRAR